MKINVLIFPAGEINSIELHDALIHNVNIEVYGASSIDRHGAYVFKNYRSNLPLINDTSFLESFNALIDEWNIDCIFPTHDTVALYLSKNRYLIRAKVITASLKTTEICRDKNKIYETFKNYSFVPKIYNDFNIFPCFMKPAIGQGGVGAKLICKAEDVPQTLKKEEYVICEYLPGDEVTVDCLTDENGDLKAVLPRKRKRMLAGVCVSSEKMNASEEVIEIAQIINKNLEFYGLWYFQIKKDCYGKYKLLEISARCAGTMCLSRARGINLPLLSVYTAMGKGIRVIENPYDVKMDRTLISRYNISYMYKTVYIDYDDTIIEGDKICIPVISFLYQCKNQGKKIVLLTRHEIYNSDSLNESMEKHFLKKEFFNEIVLLSEQEKKENFICDKESIFIDNSYAEREAVYLHRGIPVFDVEGIEVLRDWRV